MESEIYQHGATFRGRLNAYAGREIEIHLHLASGHWEGCCEAHDFCAVMQRPFLEYLDTAIW